MCSFRKKRKDQPIGIDSPSLFLLHSLLFFLLFPCLPPSIPPFSLSSFLCFSPHILFFFNLLLPTIFSPFIPHSLPPISTLILMLYRPYPGLSWGLQLQEEYHCHCVENPEKLPSHTAWYSYCWKVAVQANSLSLVPRPSVWYTHKVLLRVQEGVARTCVSALTSSSYHFYNAHCFMHVACMQHIPVWHRINNMFQHDTTVTAMSIYIMLCFTSTGVLSYSSLWHFDQGQVLSIFRASTPSWTPCLLVIIRTEYVSTAAVQRMTWHLTVCVPPPHSI